MKGIALGLAIAVGIVACMKAPTHRKEWDKRNEITALWTQIRDWRREARMQLDPAPATLFQWRGRPLAEVRRVCADGHVVPKTCYDICNLADAICENAETICGIADELGKDDQYAQEKCTSAKASCREAKQRCCDCSEEPAP